MKPKSYASSGHTAERGRQPRPTTEADNRPGDKLRRLRRELYAQGPRHLEHRVEPRLRARRQRLVEALAAEPRVLGHLRHAAGPGDVAKGQRSLRRVLVFFIA